MKLNIFSSLKKISDLEATNTQLLATIAELEEKVKVSTTDTEGFMVKQAEFDKTIEDIRKQYQAQLDEVNKQLVDATASANAKAAETLATVGVPIAELPKVSVKEVAKPYKVISHLAGTPK
jgi:hypothetical protein